MSRHATRLSRALVDVREQAGLSIPLLAARLHVDERTVERWERGQTIPPPTALVAIASTLTNVELDELLRLRDVAIRRRTR